jgi:hypothetical protein
MLPIIEWRQWWKFGRHHQIPAHKRERGGVAEFYNSGQYQNFDLSAPSTGVPRPAKKSLFPSWRIGIGVPMNEVNIISKVPSGESDLVEVSDVSTALVIIRRFLPTHALKVETGCTTFP